MKCEHVTYKLCKQVECLRLEMNVDWQECPWAKSITSLNACKETLKLMFNIYF